MSTIGIFYLENAPNIQALADRLTKAFNAKPLGIWNLTQRLLKSIPARPDDKTPPRYQHIITLSHYQDVAFVYIQERTTEQGETGPVIKIPFHQTETFLNVLNTKLSALWSRRPNIAVKGPYYDVGEYIVRLGEVHHFGQSNQSVIRGHVVSIQPKPAQRMLKGDESGMLEVPDAPGGLQHSGEAQHAKRKAVLGIWKSLGIDGAREFFSSAVGIASEEEAFEEIRLWSQILRPRH